jgi:DNA-binding beta-propeller fold protein YncE
VKPSGKRLVVPDSDLPGPNGLAFSPEEKILYVADTEQSNVYSFDVQPDGLVKHTRVYRSTAVLFTSTPTDPEELVTTTYSRYQSNQSLTSTVMELSTPLHVACSIPHKDVAELLIAKGADINSRADNGYTPLNSACLRGQKDVVELLIGGGADMNVKDNKGQTALSLANEKGHTEIVELLLKHGAKE